MDPRTRNLILAEYAVKYCEAVMSKGVGSSNQDFSLAHRIPTMPRAPQEPAPAEGWSAPVVNAVNRTVHAVALHGWKSELQRRIDVVKKAANVGRVEQTRAIQDYGDIGLSNEQRAIMVGAEVEKSGLGNCGEQSRVAFKYLITKGAGGLAMVGWESSEAVEHGTLTGNHTFVVVGMHPVTPQVSLASLDTPPQWGAHAVVCDPWYHEWFAVSDSQNQWTTKMSRILAETRPQLRTGLNRGGVLRSAEWKFQRLAYVAVAPPELKSMACQRFDDEKLKLLQQMRAPSWRGRAL